MPDFLKLANDAFAASSNYFDTAHRKRIEDAVRAFNSQHPLGSKYLSDAYKYRSKHFRPKTRAIIRKNEAASAAAMFSNMQATNIGPLDPSNQHEVASAAINQALLQYRLTTTIPWFMTYIGALQDAQTTGVVVSYQYWNYRSRKKRQQVPDPQTGEMVSVEYPEILEDEPCIELRPIENIRIDAGSEWTNPIQKSPYLIDLLPIYAVDVKRMAKANDDKTGQPKWKMPTEQQLRQATNHHTDSIQLQRESQRQDRYDQTDKAVTDYEIVWVRRIFMREPDDEYCYYTLGDAMLLSEPKSIQEVYYSDERPYVMGCAVIESHRALKSGVPDLSGALQRELNDIANQRGDNVRLVLNKHWIGKRGVQLDTDSLLKNVAGAVTLTNDPINDVREVSWPDVTQSSYVEQDNLSRDFDGIVGDFNANTRVANTGINDTLGGAKLATASSSMMTEYLIRTVNETWTLPVLRQLMKLEQRFESDANVLAIAGRKAQLFQKFGVSHITDELLQRELTMTINVGMGTMHPDDRIKKLIFAGTTIAELSKAAAEAPGLNLPEFAKELMAAAGQGDGERFYQPGGDPKLQKAMQMIQQLEAELKSKKDELAQTAQIEQAKIQSNERIKGAELQIDHARVMGDLEIKHEEVALAKTNTQLKAAEIHLSANQIEAPPDPLRSEAETAEIMANVNLKTAQADLARTQAGVAQAQGAAGVDETNAKTAKVNAEANAIVIPANEHRQGLEDISSGLVATFNAMQDIFGQQHKAHIEQMQQIGNTVGGIGHGIGLIANAVTEAGAKPKAKGFSIKKDGGVTKAVVVHLADGTTEEMPVGTMQ